MIDILAVVGPTASGKSALAIELAKRLDGVIISCDSMQIYKKMDIGTAKPTAAERAEAPHRMIDFVEPGVKYSCADYAADADAAISDAVSQGKLPIVCGGTGLYFDALVYGSGTADIEVDAEYKSYLDSVASTENGADRLYSMLEEIDSEAAGIIHKNNVKRVVRTLVINHSTGLSKREWDEKSKKSCGKYNPFVICLEYKDRENLYARINRRVDIMLSEGLIRETEELYRSGCLTPDSTAGQAIGYKELLPYLNGEITVEEAAENLKMSTRRYAKRQLTWFRRYPDIHRIYPDDVEAYKTFEDIVNFAVKLFNDRDKCDII